VNNTPIPGSPFSLQVHSLQSHYTSLDSRFSSISSIGLNISEGQFQCPRGLCLDSSSSLLFVADEDSSRILTFSTKNGGSFRSSFKLDTSPHCLALFPPTSSPFLSSILLVTCGDNSVRIYEAPEGRLIRHIQLSSPSPSPSPFPFPSTSFRNPWGVFIDKEEVDRGYYRVFVADTSNHRVVIFRCSLFESGSTTGNTDQILRTLGTRRGIEEGELTAPVGICCDSEGEVFVVENGNSRISQFSSKTGEFRKTFWEAGLLEYPWGIAIDGKNSRSRRKESRRGSESAKKEGETTGEEEERLIVCDWGNNRLVVFNKKTGEVISKIVPKNSEELVSPLYVEIEKEEGRIYVSDSNGIQTF
jgi:DNA-binding beta-propeller fold protein YncE